MRLPLLLLLRHPRRLILSQPPPNRTSLLWSEIEREELLLSVEETELLALVGVDDGEDAGDGFADVVAGENQGQLLHVAGFEVIGNL